MEALIPGLLGAVSSSHWPFPFKGAELINLCLASNSVCPAQLFVQDAKKLGHSHNNIPVIA